MSDTNTTTILSILEKRPQMSVRTMAKRSNIQKKRCRAILRNLHRKGVIQKVPPSIVGSNKTKISLYKTVSA